MKQTDAPHDTFKRYGLSEDQSFALACEFLTVNDLWDEPTIPEALLLSHAVEKGCLPNVVLIPYLWDGCRTGCLFTVCLCLAHVHPNIKDSQGNTPLHVAVPFPAIVLALLESGASPSAVNEAGDTPLSCATDTRTSLTLLAKGACL